ncbi:acyl-CoA thioesterase [Limisalsivibrio acetivorans]|uniref:acyl-CoA thioesterase n=1 Tax=Limisalsivibrio acetivorans TaxID=1304888 RepID=UPI0003B63A45|nr:thioesterase family protein [Limisalsivibrio acetivorans]
MTDITSKPFGISRKPEIRSYDIDFAGVVSNIVYIRWMEDLRNDMLIEHYPLSKQVELCIGPVVNKTQAHYKRPLRIGDEPEALMWISGLDRLRWFITMEIYVGTKLHFRGEQSGAFVNLKTGKLIGIPDIFKEEWERYLAS